MKHLKTKLVSAIAMLAVAAIMMTSATYAWFTISTNPIVDGADASVTANGNLEIALDAGSHTAPANSTTADYGKNTTWGNTVDVSKVFTDSTLTLKPVQAVASSSTKYFDFQYPVYGTDGRIKELKTLTRVKAADSTVGGNFNDLGGVAVYATSNIGAVTSNSIASYSADIYAFEIDYWLRTNKSSAVLELKSSASETVSNVAAMNDGNGSKLTLDNVTVIIVVSSAVDAGSYGDGLKYFKAERASDGTLSLKEVNADLTAKADGATSYHMPANKEVEVRTFVYMDGTSITNADAKQVLTAFTLDIQFTVGDLTAMVVTPTT